MVEGLFCKDMTSPNCAVAAAVVSDDADLLSGATSPNCGAAVAVVVDDGDDDGLFNGATSPNCTTSSLFIVAVDVILDCVVFSSSVLLDSSLAMSSSNLEV